MIVGSLKSRVTLVQEFGVPYSRLRRCVHGHSSRSTRPATNKCLDDSQEQALINWIVPVDDANSPPTPQDIEGCANEILTRSDADDGLAIPVSKRLPNNYRHIVQKPMEAERLVAERLPTILDCLAAWK